MTFSISSHWNSGEMLKKSCGVDNHWKHFSAQWKSISHVIDSNSWKNRHEADDHGYYNYKPSSRTIIIYAT